MARSTTASVSKLRGRPRGNCIGVWCVIVIYIDQSVLKCNGSDGSFASILACPQHVRLRGNLGSSRCPILPVEGIGLAVIQATKREPRIMRYDRRLMNGIFWVLRSGAPWRDLPVSYGPRTTCYNRFVRWRQAGV